MQNSQQNKKARIKDIAIIGGGPAGLIAAEMLAKNGHDNITIYDRMPSPARKLLIAGRGGLNLTHSEDIETFITRYGEASSFLAPFIKNFTPDDLRKWCEELGEETFIGTSGRVFPKSMKAVSLLRKWLKRLDGLNVEYKPKHNWLGWENGKLKFADAENQTIFVKADITILALGGASWPRLGSDGSWVEILKNEGIEISPLRPSNCGFVTKWSDIFIEKFAGAPLKSIKITHGKNSKLGEAMITAKGIEGGAIYALSSSIREAIIKDGETKIFLDIRPDIEPTILAKKFGKPRGDRSLTTYLRSLGLSPVVINLLREVLSSEQLSNLKPAELANYIKNIPLILTDTTGITRAISSAGGIKLGELDDDLMLKKKPGVYAIGEMLDWEAPTGGYLLQACFSMGVAVAKGIEKNS